MMSRRVSFLSRATSSALPSGSAALAEPWQAKCSTLAALVAAQLSDDGVERQLRRRLLPASGLAEQVLDVEQHDRVKARHPLLRSPRKQRPGAVDRRSRGTRRPCSPGTPTPRM
jgi:hypothetical protein